MRVAKVSRRHYSELRLQCAGYLSTMTWRLWKTAQLAKSTSRHSPVKLCISIRYLQDIGKFLYSCCEGNHYLIVAHYFLKFSFIRKMPHACTSAEVVNATCQLFAEQGIPECIVSEYGRHFDSSTYKDFMKTLKWGFSHDTSSPHSPKANVFIERMVQTVKNTLKNAWACGIYLNRQGSSLYPCHSHWHLNT